jgi:carnitine O-acetyltransferase
MLRFQGELERLPVPELAGSCALYLDLVRPLLAESEFESTRQAASEFVEPGGEGERLQERLLRWSQEHENWLEPFWDDWYLLDDTPLPVNVSPAFVLSGTGRRQVPRAARLLAAALRFKQLVDEERLEPDLVASAPRCMFEYSRLFASTRIPGAARDRLERHPDSRHVVVACANRFFSLDVLDEGGSPHAVEDLQRALQQIVDSADTHGVPVGVLTTGRRRLWAGVREEHLGHGPARDFLRAVESAILLLALDSPAPAHPRSADAARLFLEGDACGRWFDKSLQLVVAGNGVAGICMEHAGFDGSTLLRLAGFLVENEDAYSLGAAGRELASTELRFEPDAHLFAEIERAEREVDALCRRTDVAVLDFREFGRRAIVGQGLSPDGFVQMAFQLANSRLQGGPASTYESVSTKRFLHGRTEAMRSVSLESVAFVRSLGESHRRARDAEALLRAAIARHGATLTRCREGRGVERHLLGLRRMLEPDEPLPSLFADEGYSTLTRSVLSTSALPSSPGVELTCFGPVVEEGFGLSYTIHDDRMCCAVTNFDGLAGDFAAELERALTEMHALLVEGTH